MPQKNVRIGNSAPRGTALTAPNRTALLLAFLCIYVVWGSTYLAIRYAVETIPPLMVAGLRHVVAGSVLLAWAWSRGYRPTLQEWRASVVLGFLYFVLGHGSLHWAETVVPSGWAALLIASEPIWIAVLAALASHRERLTGKTVAGLLLGIAGVGLLVGAETAMGERAVVIGSMAILFGTIAWSVGVMYALKAPLPRHAMARAGMPEIVGSVVLMVVAGGTGEWSKFQPTAIAVRSWASLLYLIVLGSIVTFTAYTWLLDHVSPTLVSTHTYVNPIIAVLIGWLWAGELVNSRVIGAGTLTLLAVFLISKGTRTRIPAPTEDAELP
ncbi:MAG TPA: EamA family transporter [Candidatus Bathyarchaeia archaeon]|nr:EamA family transporter [Candidatus Bathyarchaeia archaeon]